MSKKVRVRFAPSPTGGLHLGGVRTVLYNYLFARKHGGEFVLRVEDTDQKRFVAGAEDYIVNCLKWCGLEPDESPEKGGPFAPYRQSERKAIYQQYAQQLIASGHAYYAFDTAEELEHMRIHLKSENNPSPQYDRYTRMHMKNSLGLTKAEVDELLQKGTPYVVRIKVPENETVVLTDMIRGEVSFDTNLLDDKVLMKADGMPTYHLAVVVDDHLMHITHAFRGEEWLPSAPVHVLLWKYLGWINDMPQWVHLPLIMGPDGKKLSKRHGNTYGFPIFAMNWTDPVKNEFTEGFKERGFLPEAFINLLALLGWSNDKGTEILSLEELIHDFDIHRVHSSGAIFDFEKAKWFNHQYLQKADNTTLTLQVKPYIEAQGIKVNDAYLAKVVALIKERCMLLPDFWEQGQFFFKAPQTIDVPAIKDKWTVEKQTFFESWVATFHSMSEWSQASLEQGFNELMQQQGIKKGDVLLPLRIMLVGGKFGPGVFHIAEMIGKEDTTQRIRAAIALLQ
ncbi:MAG: glutamate--tRNA ligase [Bacteroidota bacterium]